MDSINVIAMAGGDGIQSYTNNSSFQLPREITDKNSRVWNKGKIHYVGAGEEGVIDEEKVDTFNVPCYFSSPQELEQVINQNGRFTIEMMESLPKLEVPKISSIPQVLCRATRAITEELIKEHFGHEILDQVFGLFQEKIVKALDRIMGTDFNLFMLLKLKEETCLD
ncbi:hypothetical protein DH2020_038569 [Rehmannia glutinosa]|uniref:Uncharacterized protein n=1 Tax=Rehmannia glutinosa TaxID=99300 RepID=A0ABR0V0E8_REHGL